MVWIYDRHSRKPDQKVWPGFNCVLWTQGLYSNKNEHYHRQSHTYKSKQTHIPILCLTFSMFILYITLTYHSTNTCTFIMNWTGIQWCKVCSIIIVLFANFIPLYAVQNSLKYLYFLPCMLACSVLNLFCVCMIV